MYPAKINIAKTAVEEFVCPYPLMDEDEINGSGDWTGDEVI